MEGAIDPRRQEWSKLSPLSYAPATPARSNHSRSAPFLKGGPSRSRSSRLAPLPALSSTANRKSLLEERQAQIKAQLKQVEVLLGAVGVSAASFRADDPEEFAAPPPLLPPVELLRAPALPPIREMTPKLPSTPFPAPQHGMHMSWPTNMETISRWAQDGKPFGMPLPSGTNVGGVSLPGRILVAGMTSLPTIADHPVLRP